jgi:hypothetical protein
MKAFLPLLPLLIGGMAMALAGGFYLAMEAWDWWFVQRPRQRRYDSLRDAILHPNQHRAELRPRQSAIDARPTGWAIPDREDLVK